MKNFIESILLACVFLLFACGGDDDVIPSPEPENVILTIDATKAKIEEGEEIWYFIVDEEGDSLQAKLLKRATKGLLKFSAETSSDSLTIVEVRGFGSNGYGVSVFGGIPINSVIKSIDSPSQGIPHPEVSGEVSISVTNFPALVGNSLNISSSDDWQHVEPASGDPSITSFPLYTDNTPILLSAFNSDKQIAYKWLTDVKPGDQVVQDMNTFVPYENVIELPADHGNLFYLISGYDEDWEFYGTFFSAGQFSAGSDLSPVMGYLPGYSGYCTQIEAIVSWAPQTPRVAVAYLKRGDLPTNLALPGFDHSLTNTSVKSPQMPIDRDFTYAHAVWYSPDNSDFGVYAYWPKSFDIKLTKLPNILKTKLPQQVIDALELRTVTYYERLDGYTYEDWTTDYFARHFAQDKYEYRMYSVQP